MSKKYWLPDSDIDRLFWFENFKNKIVETYVNTFNLTKSQITVLTNDYNVFKYCISLSESAKTFQQATTKFK